MDGYSMEDMLQIQASVEQARAMCGSLPWVLRQYVAEFGVSVIAPGEPATWKQDARYRVLYRVSDSTGEIWLSFWVPSERWPRKRSHTMRLVTLCERFAARFFQCLEVVRSYRVGIN